MEDQEQNFDEIIEQSMKDNEIWTNRIIELKDILSNYDNMREELNELLWKKRKLEKELPVYIKLRDEELKKKELEDLLRQRSAKFDELTATAVWREWAFDHQIEGAKILAVAGRGVLADERGLGKTLTSLIWLDMLQVKKALVITKNDLVPQFAREVMKWVPHRAVIPLANENKSTRTMVYESLKFLDNFIVVLNFEAWRRDRTVVRHLMQQGFEAVIIDEAHNLKEFGNKTTKGVSKIITSFNHCPKHGFDDYLDAKTCPICGSELDCSVKHVLSMTGTPLLNRPQELFTMLHYVDPILYALPSNFLNMYCIKYGNRWHFRAGGANKLFDTISHFFVQRKRKDAGIVVPPPAIIEYNLDFDEHERQGNAYETLSQSAAMVLSTGEVFSIPYLLTILLRQRQVTAWPAGIDFKDEKGNLVAHFDVAQSVKIDWAENLIEELIEEGERVILFSNFKAPLDELKKRLESKDISVCQYTGDTPKWERTEIEQDFDIVLSSDNPKYQVMLATYKAGGEGLNFGAASSLIQLDEEWNPGRNEQAIGRIDRLNSTKRATVHIARVVNTADTFIKQLNEEKKAIVNNFESAAYLADVMLNAIRKGEL